MSNDAKCLNCLLTEHLHIKDSITNGDVIKALFPTYGVEIEGVYVTCWVNEHKWIGFDLYWWNAPYKGR